MREHRRNATAVRALTLVELLVVLGVVAVLAGLLLPNVIDPPQQRNKPHNSNNLRQMAIGIAIYSDESSYGCMPRWRVGRDDKGDGATGDVAEQELVTALGRLYAGGDGIISDWKVFSCPGNPSKAPNTHGPQINGKDDINHDDETSYSYTLGAALEDPANKIIVADEGNGAGKGFHNWDDGQTILFMEGSVRFADTDNPEDDADDGSIYVEDAGDRKDTILY